MPTTEEVIASLSPMQLDTTAKQMFDLVPEDGSTIGNTRLMRLLNISSDQYFQERRRIEHLIEFERGRGGSVRRRHDFVIDSVVPEEIVLASGGVVERERESARYKDFRSTLEEWLPADYDVEENNNYLLKVTAEAGRRRTGGTWSRPDFTFVGVRVYPFVYGKTMDIVTFELKPRDNWDIEAVFETLSHSRWATESYLAVERYASEDEPDELRRADLRERTEQECARLGIGLIYFKDACDLRTWDFWIDPIRRNPDPHEMNTFLSKTFSDVGERTQLAQIVR
jgi:hypothetical protein